MHRSTIGIVVALGLFILFFAYFFWPTPYVYLMDDASHRAIRVDRFTGRVEYAMDPGWQTVEEMSGIRR